MGRPRSSKTVVGKLFDAAEAPIFLLDPRRRIAYCNPACAAWLKVESEEDLVGRQCDYHSITNTDGSDSKAAALCPPPEAFEGIEVTAFIDNGVEARETRFLPVFDEDQRAYTVLGIPCDGQSTLSRSGTQDHTADHELHDHIRIVRRALQSQYSIDKIVGTSPAMRLVRRQILAAAASHSNVVVFGPEGCGSEAIARTIHYSAADPDNRSLLPLACELLDSDLLANMLDAFADRANEQSDAHSTLLLLDVDLLRPDGQATLAQFLADRVNLQVLATATKPLDQTESLKPDASPFHQGLRCVLETMTIQVPALRDRLADLPALVQCAIERENALGGKQVGRMSTEALDVLAAHSWPRDVDELFEVVSHAHAATRNTLIEKDDLPEILKLAQDAELHPRSEPERIDLDQFLGEAETDLIRRALRQSKGNKTQAAALLGINRARLLRRIEHLKLD